MTRARGAQAPCGEAFEALLELRALYAHNETRRGARYSNVCSVPEMIGKLVARAYALLL